MRGISTFGALHALLQSAHWHPGQEPRVYVGSSAGSIVAATMAMHMNPKDVLDACILPFKYERHVKLKDLNKTFGLDSGTYLQKFIRQCVDPSITFRDVYIRHGTTLGIVGTNLTQRRMELYDHVRTPNMLVSQALRISCSVPLIFAAVRDEETDDVLVDGGLSNSFPLDVAKSIYGCRHVLGITFDQERVPLDSIERYVSAIVETVVQSNSGHRGVAGCDVLTIPAPAGDTALDFELSPEHKRRLFQHGMDCMRDWLKKRS
jgi:predicted acylesterase/phospholipase RssA